MLPFETNFRLIFPLFFILRVAGRSFLNKLVVFLFCSKIMEPVLPVPESTDENPQDVESFTLGRRLRHFRQAAGLTLRDLAEAAGTTSSHLSLIENGHREPCLTLLKDLTSRTRGRCWQTPHICAST